MRPNEVTLQCPVCKSSWGDHAIGCALQGIRRSRFILGLELVKFVEE